MSLTLRTTLGCTEAVLAESGGLKEFYHIANLLSQDFDVDFSNKEDDFDTIDWEFKHRGQHLTLRYSIYNGVSLFPSRNKDAGSKENKVVVDLANQVENKLFNESKRHIA